MPGADRGSLHGGNVGIGTATPGAKLHITADNANGTGGTNQLVINGASNANQQLQIGYDTSHDYALLQSVKQGTAYEPLLLNPSGGNVGIGTTAPAARLSFGTSSGGLASLHLYDGGATVRSGMGINTNEFQLFAANSAHFSFNTGGDLQGVGTNELMRIQPNGNVGIGTTNPGYKLQLNTTAQTIDGFQVVGSDGHYAVLRASASINANNNLVLAGDAGIVYSSGTIGTGGFTITPWASATSGIRLDANGNVGIGSTSPSTILDVYTSSSGGWAGYFKNVANTSTTNGIVILAGSQTTAGSSMVYFQRNGDAANIGSISQNTASTVSYNTTSDRRLKENISGSASGLDLLARIRVRDYNYITDPAKQTQQGFIAQELYDIYPQAVTVGGEDPKTHPWQVDYGKLTPLLVKSVQELQAENDQLKARVDKAEADSKAKDDAIAQLKAFLCSQFPTAPMCHL